MIEYVLVFAKVENSDDVLIIEKQKPEWMRGKLNLLGGKIEDGESPEEASARELFEESGIQSLNLPEYMGRIEFNDVIIYCCRAFVEHKEVNPRFEEIEKVFWTTFDEVKNDSRLMPNLRVIMPLINTGVKNWVIYDCTDINNKHYLSIVFSV